MPEDELPEDGDDQGGLQAVQEQQEPRAGQVQAEDDQAASSCGPGKVEATV